MKLSIVIPAYNEEKYLPATLTAVKTALLDVDNAEVIVVDNESTDSTRAIAESYGATIVTEREHNISAVRNAGAREAAGNVVVFLDADTLVSPGVFEKIIDEMSDSRCIGGSVAVEYDEARQRPWTKLYLDLAVFIGRILKMRQGALQFCGRDSFRELGGYDETIYVGEDIEFHWRLDKLAAERGSHTVFITEPKVRTSSRRWEKMSLLRMLIVTHPVTIFLFWRVRSVWKDWYDDAIR